MISRCRHTQLLAARLRHGPAFRKSRPPQSRLLAALFQRAKFAVAFATHYPFYLALQSGAEVFGTEAMGICMSDAHGCPGGLAILFTLGTF